MVEADAADRAACCAAASGAGKAPSHRATRRTRIEHRGLEKDRLGNVHVGGIGINCYAALPPGRCRLTSLAPPAGRKSNDKGNERE